MADRELYYGDPGSESPRYRVRDTDPQNGGDYVVERLDANGDVVDTPIQIDDVNDEVALGLAVAIGQLSADSATVTTEFTDASGTAHTGQLADDGDAQPPESHDNTAHSVTFAIDGDAQPPETHGDGVHEYDLQIDGVAITSTDTINFLTQ